MDGKKGIVPGPFIFDPLAPARLVGTLQPASGVAARLKRGREEQEPAPVESGHGRLKHAKALPPGSGAHGAPARKLIAAHRGADGLLSADACQQLFGDMLDKPPSQLREFAACVVAMLAEGRDPLQMQLLREGLCAAVMARSTSQADTGLHELLGAMFEVLGTDEVKPVLDLLVGAELDRVQRFTRKHRALTAGATQGLQPAPTAARPDLAGLQRRVQWLACALWHVPAAGPRERMAPLLRALIEMAAHPALSVHTPRALETMAGMLVATCDALPVSSTQDAADAREAWLAVLACVTDPAAPFSAGQRPCMVFHLAQAGAERLGLADAPALLLEGITGRRDLAADDAGVMVWALCLQLGPPAAAHAWNQGWDLAARHRQLDVRASVQGLLRSTAALSPPALARLGAALWKVTGERMQTTAGPLGQAMAVGCKSLSWAQRAALVLGCALAAGGHDEGPIRQWEAGLQDGNGMTDVLGELVQVMETPASLFDWTGLTGPHKAALLDMAYARPGVLNEHSAGKELLQILCLQDTALRDDALMSLCQHGAAMLSGSSIAAARASLLDQLAMDDDGAAEGLAPAMGDTIATLLALYEHLDQQGILSASLIEREIAAVREDAPPASRELLLAQLEQLRARHADSHPES